MVISENVEINRFRLRRLTFPAFIQFIYGMCQNRLDSKQHLKISQHVEAIQYHYRVYPKEMTTLASYGCIIIIESI